MEETKIVRSILDDDPLTFAVAPGKTIGELLYQASIPVSMWDSIVVTNHGSEIPMAVWDSYLTEHEDNLAILIIPQGDNGKALLRMAAMIAISIYAPQFAAQYSSLTKVVEGATVLNAAGVAVTAGITMVGALAVNALIPPPTPKLGGIGSEDAGDSYFIGASSSAFKPMSTVPIVYGTHRMTANLATTPRIFTAGSTSVFVAAYDFGLGNCTLSDIRVGQTSVSSIAGSYDGTADNGLAVNDGQFLIHRDVPSLKDPADPLKGWNSVDLKLASVPVHYQSGTIVLDDKDDSGYLTTKPNSSAAMVEIMFPSGLVEFNERTGDEQGRGVSFEITYRKRGTVDLLELPYGTKAYAGDGLRVTGGAIGGDNDNAGGLTLAMTINPWQTSAKFGEKFYIEFNTNQDIYNFQANDIIFVNDVGVVVSSALKIVATPTPPAGTSVVFTSPSGIMVLEADNRFLIQVEVMTSTDDYARVWIRGEGLYNDRPSNGGIPFPGQIFASSLMSFNGAAGATPPDLSSQQYDKTPGKETYVLLNQYKGNILPNEEWAWSNEGTTGEVWVNGRVQTFDGVELQSMVGQFFESEAVQGSWGIERRIAYYGYVPPSNTQASARTRSGATAPAPRFGFGGGGGITSGSSKNFSVIGTKAKPLVVSIHVPFPEPGAYEIHIKRTTFGSTESTIVDGARYHKLISESGHIKNNPRALLDLKHRHTLLELAFRAGSQVSGSVPAINALVTQQIRTIDANGFNGNKWGSDNPALVCLDILTGYQAQNHGGNGGRAVTWNNGLLKNEQIDFPSWDRFMRHCDKTIEYTDVEGVKRERRLHTFNTVLASNKPIIDTVQSILGQCKAQMVLTPAGKYGIMIDEKRSLIKQLFTPSNTFNFEGSKSFTEIPHGLDVTFVDPRSDYAQSSVIYYRPGYNEDNATLVEDLETFGITDPDEAANFGRYMMGQAMYRAESFTFSTDIENLAINRGDLVGFQHDAPKLAGLSCHILTTKKTTAGVEITVDERTGVAAGWEVVWRSQGGSIHALNVISASSGKITIPDAPVDDYQRGDLVVIRDKSSSGMMEKYIVKGITPLADLQARVELVRYVEELYNDDVPLPPWNPGIEDGDIIGGVTRLEILTIKGKTDIELINSINYTTATIEWTVGPADMLDDLAQFKITFTSPAHGTFQVGLANLTARKWVNRYNAVEDSRFYDGFYTVTPISAMGVGGKPMSVSIGQRVDTKGPDRPTDLTNVVKPTGYALKFTPPADKDLAYYEVFYSNIDTSVDSATRIVMTNAAGVTEIDTNKRESGYYFLRAVDTAGNVGEAAKLYIKNDIPSELPGYWLSAGSPCLHV